MKKILKNLKRKFTVLAVTMIAIQPVLVGAVMMPAKTFAAVHDVVINEIAWGGSTSSADDEWIELYNTTGSAKDLAGWSIEGATVGGGTLTISSGTIPAHGFFLISNFDQATSKINVTPDWVTSSLTLVNANIQYILKDNLSVVVDTADDGVGAPPAGKNDLKYSMERNQIIADGTLETSWHDASTSVGFDAGATDKGTPRLQNSLSDVTPPVITVDTLKTNDTTPTITGTIDDLTADIVIQVDGGAAQVATNNGNGTWSYEVSTILPEGIHEILATATDAFLNIGSDTSTNELEIDETEPVVTVTPLTTIDTTPTITGTIDDLTADIVIQVDGGAAQVATNNGDGTWSYEVLNPLTVGSHEITVRATDTATNVGEETATINITAPVVLSPVVTTVVPAVATVVVPETVVVQDDQYGGYSSDQGEVKADTTVAQPEESNEEENKDEQKEDVKEKKNIPLWGIIFLLVLAGIGGYLFYSQSPEPTTKKK